MSLFLNHIGSTWCSQNDEVQLGMRGTDRRLVDNHEANQGRHLDPIVAAIKANVKGLRFSRQLSIHKSPLDRPLTVASQGHQYVEL